MHDRDLSGRAAETQGGDARPDLNRLAERDAMGGRIGGLDRHGNPAFHPAHGRSIPSDTLGTEILIEVVEDRRSLFDALIVLRIGGAYPCNEAGDSRRL